MLLRAIHDSHSPMGFGRLSRQKAHKLRAHGSNSSVGNRSTQIQVWISDRTQVPAGHGSPAINIAIVHSSRPPIVIRCFEAGTTIILPDQNLAHPANWQGERMSKRENIPNFYLPLQRWQVPNVPFFISVIKYCTSHRHRHFTAAVIRFGPDISYLSKVAFSGHCALQICGSIPSCTCPTWR